MKIKLLLLPSLFLISNAYAINRTNPNYVTYTAKHPQYGCYKTNKSSQCVDDTFIKCSNTLEEDVKKWGSVIASFCDDKRWYEKRLAELK